MRTLTKSLLLVGFLLLVAGVVVAKGKSKNTNYNKADQADCQTKCSLDSSSKGKACDKSNSAACEKKSSCDKKGASNKLCYGPYINTVVLKNLLESKLDFALLDARSGKWDDKTRIPGAKTLNSESSESEIMAMIPSKDTLVITYCSSLKCGASQKLYLHLKKLGYKNVLEYPFGIKGWLEAGHDIVTAI